MMHSFHLNGKVSGSDDAICLNCHHSRIYLRELSGIKNSCFCPGFYEEIVVPPPAKTAVQVLAEMETKLRELKTDWDAAFLNLGRHVTSELPLLNVAFTSAANAGLSRALVEASQKAVAAVQMQMDMIEELKKHI